MIDLHRTIDCSELLPAVSRDSKDIQEIMRIEAYELQALGDIMIEIFNNQFIETMTEYGLTQWESILDIIPIGTYDDRRREVLKVLYGLRPFTFKSFQNMLNSAYGDSVVTLELINDKYELWFNLSANGIYKRNDIYNFSEPIVPKNLLLFFKNEKECEAEMIGIGGYVTIGSIVSVQADKGVNIKEISTEPSIGGYVSIHSNIRV